MKKLLILAALVATGAHAQSSILLSGQELYARMNGTEGHRMMALGYVAGVADTKAGTTICIPAGVVTLGQMRDMVQQTLERIPSERHMPADVFVEATLAQRWPCSTSKRGNNL